MSRHVVIIGGGVIGLCTALYTARRGHRVTVLERLGPDRSGCSYGNAGMVVPSHFTPLAAPGMVAAGLKWMWNPASPFWVKPSLDPDLLRWGWQFWRASTAARVRQAEPLIRDLSLKSRELFEELSSECDNEFGIVQRGLLMLCKTPQALEHEETMARRARELGLQAEMLDPKQVASLDPGITMDVAGGVHFAQDCHLSPQKFMRTLENMCANAGVTFTANVEVTGFARNGSSIKHLQHTSGELEGDEFVLCAGSWSTGLARKLDLRLPMQAGKGYSLTLSKPRQLPRLCSILCEARVAVTPMDDTLRFGGTMEIAGLHERISPRRVQGIVDSAVRYFPEFKLSDFADVPPWCGLRPCSPDGLPFIGRTARWNNLIIATGHAMMGLSLGPATGKMVSEVLDGAQGFNSPLLSPDRYDFR
jgi:D-amino-acid dehydrogenase